MINFNLSPENQAIADAVEQDYFWSDIPFAQLSTALDVGAFMGFWSLTCRRYAPHIQITALEPHPKNYQATAAHCSDVRVLHGWCGYRLDAYGLCCRKGMDASHYILGLGDDIPEDSYILDLPAHYTLEDFGTIDLLKLDCEGSEFDILFNCMDETLRQIEVIVGEYHLDRGNMPAIIERLLPFGFGITLRPYTVHLGHFLAVRGAD